MTRILMTTVAALSFAALSAQPSFAGNSWSKNNTSGGFSCGSADNCARATGYSTAKSTATRNETTQTSSTESSAGGSADARADDGGAASANNDSSGVGEADTTGGATASRSTSNSDQSAAANGGPAD